MIYIIAGIIGLFVIVLLIETIVLTSVLKEIKHLINAKTIEEKRRNILGDNLANAVTEQNIYNNKQAYAPKLTKQNENEFKRLSQKYKKIQQERDCRDDIIGQVLDEFLT